MCLILRFSSLILLALTLSGCGSTAKFVYPSQGQKLAHVAGSSVSQKKIAVVPFKDLRGDRNNAGGFWLYLVPVASLGAVDYERPDAAEMFNTIGRFEFAPSEDLAKAAALSLRESGLFNDAFFTFGGEKDKADLVLEGEILSTSYRGTIASYGLSVAAPFPWFFGLPAGTSRNEMNLRLVVKDVPQQKILWQKSYERQLKVTQGLYYKFGDDARGYSQLMQDIMNDAVEEMSRTFQQQNSK